MAARSPRRTFLTPFVITLAVPACLSSSAQQPPNPQPTVATTQADPAPVDRPRPVVIANPPRPHHDPQASTTPPEVARRWWVMNNGTDCYAGDETACPPVPPGGAPWPCNPPRPQPYPCPPGLAVKTLIEIEQSPKDGTCRVVPAPVQCPPNAMCNPPRPQAIACP